MKGDYPSADCEGEEPLEQGDEVAAALELPNPDGQLRLRQSLERGRGASSRTPQSRIRQISGKDNLKSLEFLMRNLRRV